MATTRTAQIAFGFESKALKLKIFTVIFGVLVWIVGMSAASGAWAGAGGLPTPLARRLLDPQGPAHEGPGCPAGMGGVSVTVTPDARSVSVIFDQFRAEVSADGGKPVLARTYCVIRVPVEVPAGYALSVVRADYRGFAYIVGKTAGQVSSTIQLGSLKKPASASIEWKGPSEPDDYFFSQSIAPTSNNRLLCGDGRPSEIAIRVDLQLRSHQTQGEIAMLTLDSIDSGPSEGEGGLSYGLDWQPCSGKK